MTTAPNPVDGFTGIKRQWIEATIIRADGTVEHLGVIADTRLRFRVAQFLKCLPLIGKVF